VDRDLIKRLRSRIREFEDKKISGGDLGREIFHVAREVADPSEASLRRSLEAMGNRVTSLSEQSLTEYVHPRILSVVDELESELVLWGY
jgi:hypothetical protein